jgi:hypothetical protein
LFRPQVIKNPNVLYLDFDGVLHPQDVYVHPKRGVYLAPTYAGHSLFENVPVLVEALADFPSVKVVLSTSWVPGRGFAQTLKRLPPELRERVIGATFHSQHMLHENWVAIARGYQILADVGRRRPSNWVALDDDYADWPEEHLHRLVKCDPLLGVSRLGAVAELRVHLERWEAQRQR